MKSMKVIRGWTAAVLGGSGVLASLGLIIYLWMIKSPLENRASDILTTLDNSVVFVQEKLHQAQEEVAGFQRAAQDAKSYVAEADVKKLSQVVQVINTQIGVAKLMLTVSGVKLKAFDKGARVVDEAPLLTLGEDVSSPSLNQHVHEALRDVDTLESTVIRIVRLFEEIQDKEALKQHLAHLSELIDELELEITAVQLDLQRAEDRAGKVKEGIEKLKQDLPGWLNRVAVLATLALFWIALGQACLLWYGITRIKASKVKPSDV